MFQHLTDEHIKYIIIRYHIESVRPGEIFNELTHEDALVLYGVQPSPGLTLNYLYRRIPRIPNTTVEIVKQEWLNGLLEEPLANKRVRIKELTKLFKKAKSDTIKCKILKDIKEEIGEDAWRDALEKSGAKVNITLQDEMKKFFETVG